MTLLPHTRKILTGRWMFLLVLLLMACLTQVVLTQDTPPLDESLSLPTDSVDESLPTSDIPDEPVIQPSDEPQQSMSITMESRGVGAPENAVLSLTFVGRSLANVASLTIICHADPAFMLGTQSSLGELFSRDQEDMTDSGFQPDGQWRLTANQPQFTSELSGSGVLWSLNYQMIVTGVTQIACAADATDSSGQQIPLEDAEMTLRIESYQAPTAVPPLETPIVIEENETASPIPEDTSSIAEDEASPTPEDTSSEAVTASPIPEDTSSIAEGEATAPIPEDPSIIEDNQGIVPVSSTDTALELMPTPQPTAEAELTPIPIPVIILGVEEFYPVAAEATDAPELTQEPSPVAALSRLSGSVEDSPPLMQVTVMIADLPQIIAVRDDGQFAIDIPAGPYEMTFSAPEYVSYSLIGLISTEPITLAPVRMVRTDEPKINPRATVDLVIENFGLEASLADSAADVNGDNMVDIYDLVLVSARN